MEYKEDKFTEWFDIKKQKPVDVGVYQVNTSIGYRNGFAYSYWNGEEWNYTCNTPDDAYSHKHVLTSDDIAKWRGLNFKPAKPKKQGNKRKTMYVVMAQNKKTLDAECDGAFAKKENAEARKQSALKIAGDTHRVWIQKIRFRTPEA